MLFSVKLGLSDCGRGDVIVIRASRMRGLLTTEKPTLINFAPRLRPD